MAIDKSGGVGDGHIYSNWTSYWSTVLPLSSSVHGRRRLLRSCTVIPTIRAGAPLAVDPGGGSTAWGDGDDFVVSALGQRPGPGEASAVGPVDHRRPGRLHRILGGPQSRRVARAGGTSSHSCQGPGAGGLRALFPWIRRGAIRSTQVLGSTNGGLTWSAPSRVTTTREARGSGSNDVGQPLRAARRDLARPRATTGTYLSSSTTPYPRTADDVGRNERAVRGLNPQSAGRTRTSWETTTTLSSESRASARLAPLQGRAGCLLRPQEPDATAAGEQLPTALASLRPIRNPFGREHHDSLRPFPATPS